MTRWLSNSHLRSCAKRLLKNDLVTSFSVTLQSKARPRNFVWREIQPALYLLHVLLRGVLVECSPPFLRQASHLVLRWLISHDLSGEGKKSSKGKMDCIELNCKPHAKLAGGFNPLWKILVKHRFIFPDFRGEKIPKNPWVDNTQKT